MSRNRVLEALGRVVNFVKLRKDPPRGSVSRVMIYSPNLGGHRPIYSSKIVRALNALGVRDVHFVYCGLRVATKGPAQFVPVENRHFDSIASNPTVTLHLELERFLARKNELDFIVQLQKEIDPDCTLFIDGDDLIETFIRQLRPFAPVLRGRNYAVFILSEFFHMGSLRWRQAFFNPNRRPYLLHKLFHQHLLRYVDLLDGGFHSDECLVRAARSEKFLHLPEVGHSRLDSPLDPDRQRFYRDVRERLQKFLSGHPGKEVILSFGDLEPRKGFDLLLRLAAENPDLILVRVGRIKPSYHHTWKCVLNKEKLVFEGRIFELEHYVEDQELIDLLFGSVRYVLLPYKNFYRTTSVMIQTLSYSLPVLTPHIGLPGHRVRENSLGRVFRHLNYDDFVREYTALREDPEAYRESIREYYGRNFSDEAFLATLGAILESRPCETGEAHPLESEAIQGN